MNRALTLSGYVALVVLAGALELYARRTARVARLAEAVRALTTRPPLHVLVLASWLWLGWHLFVRAHH